MSSNLYNIYRNNTLQLAKTLIIKSAESARLLNEGLIEYGVSVDDTRPETWMYYMNLAGEYHPLNVPMTVLSQDTLEEIPFTKESLLEHRATARSYYYGSSYYRALVDRYPAQEALIRGIIDPVDKEQAIAAADFTILSYNRTLVEAAETNLIPELQRWIKAFARNWYNPGFLITEDHYLAGLLAMMHFQIPIEILNIRNRNRHTGYVHSFHLWSFLGGHNYLDDYKEFLTRNQAMWLYKNIRYIEANAGRTENFHELIEHIMTERGFPIGAYSMYQNSDTMPEEILPDAGVTFKPLNFKQEQEITHGGKTLDRILEQEHDLAKFNPDFYGEDLERITTRVKVGLSNMFTSKVLESSVYDKSMAQPIRMIDILLNHWIYWAYSGTYTTMISVQNPHNGETIVMDSKDAVVAFYYCLNRSFGIRLKDIPDIEVWGVLNLKLPTTSELRKLAPPQYISDYLIRTAQDAVPQVRKIVSTETFYLKCNEIREMRYKHRELYALREHFRSRGFMEMITRHHLITKRIPLVSRPTSFTQFFKERNWDLENLPEMTYTMIAQNIITTVTGQDLFYVKTVSEVQSAMLRLLQQLSSYAIHVIRDGQSTEAIVLDWAAIRVGDLGIYGSSEIRTPWAPISVKRTKGYLRADVDYQLTRVGSTIRGWIRSLTRVKYDPSISYHLTGKCRYGVRGLAPSVYYRFGKAVSIEDLVHTVDLPGLVETHVQTGDVDLNKPELPGLNEK